MQKLRNSANQMAIKGAMLKRFAVLMVTLTFTFGSAASSSFGVRKNSHRKFSIPEYAPAVYDHQPLSDYYDPVYRFSKKNIEVSSIRADKRILKSCNTQPVPSDSPKFEYPRCNCPRCSAGSPRLENYHGSGVPASDFYQHDLSREKDVPCAANFQRAYKVAEKNVFGVPRAYNYWGSPSSSSKTDAQPEVDGSSLEEREDICGSKRKIEEERLAFGPRTIPIDNPVRYARTNQMPQGEFVFVKKPLIQRESSCCPTGRCTNEGNVRWT